MELIVPKNSTCVLSHLLYLHVLQNWRNVSWAIMRLLVKLGSGALVSPNLKEPEPRVDSRLLSWGRRPGHRLNAQGLPLVPHLLQLLRPRGELLLQLRALQLLLATRPLGARVLYTPRLVSLSPANKSTALGSTVKLDHPCERSER